MDVMEAVRVTKLRTKQELRDAYELLKRNGYRPYWYHDVGTGLFEVRRHPETSDPKEIIEWVGAA